MFNHRGRVVLFLVAKTNRNISESFFYHFQNLECAQRKDHTEKYFVAKIGVLKNRSVGARHNNKIIIRDIKLETDIEAKSKISCHKFFTFNIS